MGDGGSTKAMPNFYSPTLIRKTDFGSVGSTLNNGKGEQPDNILRGSGPARQDEGFPTFCMRGPIPEEVTRECNVLPPDRRRARHELVGNGCRL